MCDHLLPASDFTENYRLDNLSRSVGQVVTVFCRNATVAIVRCMPDFKWNATAPACTGKDGGDNMGALIIIVWVVGGVLLFSLLVLIAIIITSRSKTACGFRRNGSPSTSVFHISGATHRTNGSWGDNPGFSRADERCGEWSFHRARPTESERLPSYQEAILNNYIAVPGRTGSARQEGAPTFVRANAPPSYRSSQIQNTRLANEGDRNSEQENVGERVSVGTGGAPESQNLQPNQEIDVQDINANLANDAQRTNCNQVVEAQSTEPSQEVETQRNVNSQINGNMNTGNNQQNTDSGLSAVSETQASAVCSREGRSVRPSNSSSTSRRYAENYPQCLFQDEPPPPYSSGHSRSSVYRSLDNQQRQGAQNWRRSLHVAASQHGRNENESRQNNHFRRSMHDRPENAAGPSMSNLNPRSHDYSNPSLQNNNAFHVNDPGYQSFTGWHYLPGHSSSGLHPAAGGSACQRPGLSGNSPHPQTFAADSRVPIISSSASLQRYVPTVPAAGNRNMYTNSNRNDNQNTLYIVRNVQSASSASPHLLNPQQLGLSSQPYHHEPQPLCTSTPINQSPATDRRFVPVNHPSPLLIPRHQQGRSSQEEVLFHRHRAELEGRYAHSLQQTSLPQYPLHGKQLNPSQNPGGAPIARLESEFL